MGAPITHAAGAMAVMLAAQGATVVMRPGFDAEDSLDQIERHDVTHLFIPPTAYYRMLESQRTPRRDTPSLAMMPIAAATVSQDLVADRVEAFGPQIGRASGRSRVGQ